MRFIQVVIVLSALLFLLSDASSGISTKRWEHRKVHLDESRHTEEFWTFVTRPDLDAPRWNVTVYDEDAVTPGYWFVGPYEEVVQENHSAAWNAPHIYDATGELVWSGAPIFHGFSTFDFRVNQINDKPMLTLVRPNINYAVALDETYNVYKNFDIGPFNFELDQTGMNIHEFMTSDHGTRALFLTSVRKMASVEYSAAVGFDGECHATYDGFKEMDIETWEPVFEWNSYHHISLDESFVAQDPIQERCGNVDIPWDFLHLNSIDKFPDGDYLISARRTNTIYKISRNDGSIIWRLGGHKSNFTSPVTFSGQHAAKIYSHDKTHTLISFLDNACGPGDPPTTNDASRGLLLSLNTEKMEVEVVQEFKHPHYEYSEDRGNVQWLEETDHFWTCWRSRALHTEHSFDGTLIMEAEFKVGVQNYRSFKFPWVGRPSDPPDVRSAALRSQNGKYFTIVSMSWNGATEVRRWHIYHTNPAGTNKVLVEKTDRAGFETTIWIEGYLSHVVVTAIDVNGEVLGESISVATFPTLGELARANGRIRKYVSALEKPVVTFLLGAFVSTALLLLAYGRAFSVGRKPWFVALIAGFFFGSLRKKPSYRRVSQRDEYELGRDDEDDDNGGRIR